MIALCRGPSHIGTSSHTLGLLTSSGVGHVAMKWVQPGTDPCPGPSAPHSALLKQGRSGPVAAPLQTPCATSREPGSLSLLFWGAPSCPSFPAGSQGPSAAVPSPKSFISSTLLAMSGSCGHLSLDTEMWGSLVLPQVARQPGLPLELWGAVLHGPQAHPAALC